MFSSNLKEITKQLHSQTPLKTRIKYKALNFLTIKGTAEGDNGIYKVNLSSTVGICDSEYKKVKEAKLPDSLASMTMHIEPASQTIPSTVIIDSMQYDSLNSEYLADALIEFAFRTAVDNKLDQRIKIKATKDNIKTCYENGFQVEDEKLHQELFDAFVNKTPLPSIVEPLTVRLSSDQMESKFREFYDDFSFLGVAINELKHTKFIYVPIKTKDLYSHFDILDLAKQMSFANAHRDVLSPKAFTEFDTYEEVKQFAYKQQFGCILKVNALFANHAEASEARSNKWTLLRSDHYEKTTSYLRHVAWAESIDPTQVHKSYYTPKRLINDNYETYKYESEDHWKAIKSFAQQVKDISETYYKENPTAKTSLFSPDMTCQIESTTLALAVDTFLKSIVGKEPEDVKAEYVAFIMTINQIISGLPKGDLLSKKLIAKAMPEFQKAVSPLCYSFNLNDYANNVGYYIHYKPEVKKEASKEDISEKNTMKIT